MNRTYDKAWHKFVFTTKLTHLYRSKMRKISGEKMSSILAPADTVSSMRYARYSLKSSDLRVARR